MKTEATQKRTAPSRLPENRRIYDRMRYRRDKGKRLGYSSKRYSEKRVEILAKRKQHREANREAYLLRERASNAKRRRENPRKFKSSILKSVYGITLEDYERMSAEQGGACLICDEKTKLHIDHCHATGVVRGLLCSICNRALGHFEKRGARMSEYLKKCSQ